MKERNKGIIINSILFLVILIAIIFLLKLLYDIIFTNTLCKFRNIEPLFEAMTNSISNLKNITNETLIIWGDHDKSYTFNQIMILKNNIKNSQLSIFKNCAHNVHLENVDKFNKTVKDFLN